MPVGVCLARLCVCAELRYHPDPRETAHLLKLVHASLPALTPSNCVAVVVSGAFLLCEQVFVCACLRKLWGFACVFLCSKESALTPSNCVAVVVSGVCLLNAT